MKTLFILNGAAYGSELSYNGLRLAGSLARRDDTEVRIFFMGDGVTCAVGNQQVPDGYYHLDRMIHAAAGHGALVGCCGTCLDARGIEAERLVEGATRSTLDELTEWTIWADKVITF